MRPRNLTTAATIWVAAVFGVACALVDWIVAVGAALVAFTLLVVGRIVENKSRPRKPTKGKQHSNEAEEGT